MGRSIRKKKEKWVSWVNEELELQGYKPVTSKDVIATYMSMINLEPKKLAELQKDDMQPIIVQIIAEWLLKKKWSFDILERILDRWIGKPVQRQENLNKELIITIKDYEWWECSSTST